MFVQWSRAGEPKLSYTILFITESFATQKLLCRKNTVLKFSYSLGLPGLPCKNMIYCSDFCLFFSSSANPCINSGPLSLTVRKKHADVNAECLRILTEETK